MLSDEGAKSRLSGNVDGGIVAVEEGGGGNYADLMLGDVGRGLDESRHRREATDSAANRTRFSICVPNEQRLGSVWWVVEIPDLLFQQRLLCGRPRQGDR